jgi:hypothetical protein
MRGRLTAVVGTGIGLGLFLAALDLWHVALGGVTQLEGWHVPLLVAGYVVVALVAALAVAVATRGRARSSLVGAVLLGGALFLVVQELALRALPARSGARPWATFGAAAAAVVVLAAGARALGRLRPVPTLAVLGALVAAGGWGAVRGFHGSTDATRRRAAPVPAGPNVVLVVIDTLRADHLSCYGYALPTTPNLDAFARESVLFTRAYSQSSWTKPATASLLTSHYPTMHGANLETSKLSDDETLVFEPLHDGGYATAAFTGNPWVTPEYGFRQGVDDFYSVYDERFARATLFMQILKRVDHAIEGEARAYNAVKLLASRESCRRRRATSG